MLTPPLSRMARLVAKYAPAALVAALLVATALAFVYTEKLKLTLSPILGTEGRQGASRPSATARRTRPRSRSGSARRDRITRRRDRHERRHACGRSSATTRAPRGRMTLHWDGRDADGEVVPEGSYKPRVHLVGEHRTIVLPNPMRVDVTPPHITARLAGAARLLAGRRRAQGADHRALRHRRAGPGAPLRQRHPARPQARAAAEGPDRVVRQGRRRAAAARRLPHQPRRARRRRQSRPAHAREEDPDPVRRARARPDRDRRRRPGSPCSCSAMQRACSGSSASAPARARPGTLKLRAPLQPGRYTLTVTANGFSDRAAVIVRAPKR